MKLTIYALSLYFETRFLTFYHLEESIAFTNGMGENGLGFFGGMIGEDEDEEEERNGEMMMVLVAVATEKGGKGDSNGGSY